MRKFILAILCILLLFSSCKKSAPVTTDNTISASVDGINENFNTNASASYSIVAGNYILTVNGTNAASQKVYIAVVANSAITTGTYPVTTTSQGFQIGTTITYTDGYTQLFPNLNSASANTLTITFINNAVVQGTFNVNLTGNTLSTSPVVINKYFTNGKFNVSIK